MDSAWATCLSLNQSLAHEVQESDWPSLDRLNTPGAWGGRMVWERKVKSMVAGGGEAGVHLEPLLGVLF